MKIGNERDDMKREEGKEREKKIGKIGKGKKRKGRNETVSAGNREAKEKTNIIKNGRGK